MTQPAPSERAAQALKASGINEAPMMSLERDDALFVLTGDMLVYQDGGGTRRVTLRDLTRIHSDQAGLLRVETPAGTALTASLLGFDVGQVQTFFKAVRNATARAKDLPASPTPTPGTGKTFGSAPASGNSAPASPQASGPAVSEAPEAQSPEAQTDAPAPTDRAEVASVTVVTPDLGSPAPERSEPEQTGPEQTGPEQTGRSGGGAAAAGSASDAGSPPAATSGASVHSPVVISSSSFSPHVSKPELGAGPGGAGAGNGQPPRPESRPPETRTPGTRQTGASAPDADRVTARIELPQRPTPHRPAPRTPVAIPGPAAAANPSPDTALRAAAEATSGGAGTTSGGAEAASDGPPVTALARVAAATALVRQAETVENLSGRLKILGAVLFVGALLLALFQFTGGQPLAGIWTLLSGGVGAIALLALGEMSALLSLLARPTGPATQPQADENQE